MQAVECSELQALGVGWSMALVGTSNVFKKGKIRKPIKAEFSHWPAQLVRQGSSGQLLLV